jgi:uncharacterized protein YndB with AHSA1/START domain
MSELESTRPRADAARVNADPLDEHVLSIEIDVPRQEVWDEITKTGRIQRAMMNTLLESELVPGAKLRYYSPDKKRVYVVGEVIEVTPPKRLKHTYMFTSRAEVPTIVTWELEEIATGCRVTLTHSGFTDQAKTHKDVAGGWRMILDAMKAELESGRLGWKTRFMYGLMGAMTFLQPKQTLTDEVEKAGW